MIDKLNMKLEYISCKLPEDFNGTFEIYHLNEITKCLLGKDYTPKYVNEFNFNNKLSDSIKTLYNFTQEIIEYSSMNIPYSEIGIIGLSGIISGLYLKRRIKNKKEKEVEKEILENCKNLKEIKQYIKNKLKN